MIKRIQLLVFFLLFQLIGAEEPIALISKLRGSANYKIGSENKYGTKVKVNTPIFHEGQLLTGSKSFVKVVYLDDASTISVYPETELTILGTIEDRKIYKQIDLKSGIIQVDMNLQTKGKFMLSTPHSEITCNQCKFWVNYFFDWLEARI